MPRLASGTMLVALAMVGGTASAQTARAAPEIEAIALLTSELRALRQEIARTSRASLTMQVLTARIQAQEQRIIYLDRQRTEASTRRATTEQTRVTMASQLQMFGGDQSKVPPEQRREMEGMVKMVKEQLETLDAALVQLQTEETDAATALAQEQSRWADLNQRLDDLERSIR